MNFIENYLQKEHFLDLNLNGTDRVAQQDAKLEYFYRLFVELEKKYASKIDDMKRLEREHKAELNELENYVYKVKQLTEERESLTVDFKEENDELKNKIKALERELANKHYDNHQINNKKSNKLTSDTMSSLSDDDLSEATVEMLVLEGFGNIVSLPNHEKIAVLLADRAKTMEEMKEIRAESENLIEASKLNIEKYENEIETLKLVNDKLTDEIVQLKTHISNLEEINKENEVILAENIELNKQKTSASPKKNTLLRSAQTSVDLDDNEENIAFIEKSKFEIAKLKEDNINLKLEMDKLYDEIGQFELDNKQLKDENKKSMSELSNLNELVVSLKKSKNESKSELSKEHLDEIKILKQEILDLNNELDDLIQYKDNYDSLKLEHDSLKLEHDSLRLDYDKLTATNQLNNDKLLNTTTISNRIIDKASAKPGSQVPDTTVLADQTSQNNKSKMELEWIRGENEKLLLELERTQSKLEEKIEKCNEYKQQLSIKDDQMKEFISRYESKQTNENDLLQLQKKIIELENLLSKEKEEYTIEMESNEERQKDLLKRNDQLWAQSTKMEKNYKEAMDIIRQQTERIAALETKISQLNKNATDLDDLLRQEKQINENVYSKNENLDSKLTEALTSIQELKEMNNKLNDERTKENVNNENKINSLLAQLDELNIRLKESEKNGVQLKLEIDSLNKEKTFIIGQNESTHQKVLQDYFALQEKYTSVNYQFNKLSKDNLQTEAINKEKENLISQIENEKNQLILNLKQETREKTEFAEKIKHFEATVSKNLEKINDLTDKLHRVELQKSKLELKAKELESMEIKCEHISNELNDKRETLSQVLEKNGKLEVQISDLEHQLNTAKHSIIQTESLQNEFNMHKADLIQKVEENIKLKHEHENEKNRREKAESRIEELKEEYKKLKQKMSKLQEDNAHLKHETVETKNQLEGFRSKLNLIADKSHTEVEKNNQLQDELSEIKKILELAEMKCSSYSDKFDLLLKKYETRKIKQKNKIERLWDYLQRERAKYKELLLNAQNDLSNKKAFNEKENDYKMQQENSYQQIVEEKSKLIAVMVDKDAKMREMKRQNTQLQSKIKLLEDEMENLHEKIDSTLKERNKLRKEIQMNLVSQVNNTPITSDPNLDTTLTYNVSPSHKTGTYENSNNTTTVSNLSRAISSNLTADQLEKSFKSTSSLNVNYWNEFNNVNTTSTSTIWDINYNTGYINKYTSSNLKESCSNLKRNSDASLKNVVIPKINSKPKFHSFSKNEEASFGGSMATDLNSITSTPRTFR